MQSVHRPKRILFIFLDGVGIGPNQLEINPLAHLKRGLFPLFLSADGREELTYVSNAFPGAHAVLDAGLDVPGTPQSATGQASLLTGNNGAKLVGFHLTAFPTPDLGKMVRAENLLVKAQRAGKSATFLNTYTPRFFEMEWPHSVSTISALSLNQPLLMLDAMHEGRSLFHDITQETLRDYLGDTIPVFSPRDAGHRLARAASFCDVSLFEHFMTDRIGHKAHLERGISQIQKVEEFLYGVLEATDLTETLVVVGTDHGNLEDARTHGHTKNPVAFSAWGVGCHAVTQHLKGLCDVTPALLSLL